MTRLRSAAAALGAVTVAACTAAQPGETGTAGSPASLPAGSSATVVRVVDGDTVHVRGDQLGEVTVRVLGIDTPETVKPGSSVACGGPEASAHAHQVLDGTSVTVVPDPSQDQFDRYGRTLAYLELPDGSDYSVATVAAGYARTDISDRHPVAKADELAAAQTQAQQAHTGIWGRPCNGSTDSTPTTGVPR